ncbi:MAG: phage tail spike protein, partial [Culicoidibacterales bacterium]
MMYLYDQNELSFQRNGKTIQNAFNAKVVHYLNSEYTLTFSVLMSDEIAKDLEINKIVFAENQPFRITTIQPSLKEFKVYARHVFFDLLDYQVENVNVNSATGQTVMNAIFSNNDTNFTYTSDITKRSTMNDSKKNIVEMLARAIERFEGELKRDKFSVALNNKIGKDTNYIVYPNKNISASVKETDVTNVCTRVIVEYGEYEDIKQVIVVSENVDLYPQAKTKRYQNLDLKTEADAIAWGKGKFQGINRIDVPKVSIEIDLSLDRELSGLEIGDTLICKIPTLKLDERIQIIGYEFDPSMNLRT